MSQFDKYKQKPPAVFTRIVGVNYGTFTIILEKLQVVFYKYQSEKPKRRSGKSRSLSLADQLYLTNRVLQSCMQRFEFLEISIYQRLQLFFVIVNFIEEVVNSLSKNIWVRRVVRLNDLFFEEFPKPFDRIKIGGVGWQKTHLNP